MRNSRITLSSIQSSTEHEEFGVNAGGPSPKAKYDLMTDSEQVPWGKGEKNPGRGVKENLKPYVYKRRKRYSDLVLFVERAGELRCVARLSD